MKYLDMKKIVISLWLVLAMVFSITVIAPRLASPKHVLNQYVIQSVDDKIETVMELSAGSTAASIAISAIPDDTATPLADKLSDFSSYFLIVLCVLFLEKYLITILGPVGLGVLLPAAIALGIAYFWIRKKSLLRWAYKLGILGLFMALVIPISVHTSDRIYSAYEISMQETVSEAEGFSLEVESGTEEENAEVSGVVSKVLTKVTSIGASVIKKAKNLITSFMEALAVMIVTSCLIPLVVLFISWKFVKYLLKQEFLFDEKNDGPVVSVQ